MVHLEQRQGDAACPLAHASYCYCRRNFHTVKQYKKIREETIQLELQKDQQTRKLDIYKKNDLAVSNFAFLNTRIFPLCCDSG